MKQLVVRHCWLFCNYRPVGRADRRAVSNESRARPTRNQSFRQLPPPLRTPVRARPSEQGGRALTARTRLVFHVRATAGRNTIGAVFTMRSRASRAQQTEPPSIHPDSARFGARTRSTAARYVRLCRPSDTVLCRHSHCCEIQFRQVVSERASVFVSVFRSGRKPIRSGRYNFCRGEIA